MVFPELILEDYLMPETPQLYCSDDLLHSLVKAAHCSFILLAMRNEDKSIDVFDVANLLSVETLAADDLVNTLLHFGFILPVEDGDQFTITASGVDMLSPQPENSPWHYDPELPNQGARLPTYVAFDLLPLRIWSYHRSLSSKNN